MYWLLQELWYCIHKSISRKSTLVTCKVLIKSSWNGFQSDHCVISKTLLNSPVSFNSFPSVHKGSLCLFNCLSNRQGMCPSFFSPQMDFTSVVLWEELIKHWIFPDNFLHSMTVILSCAFRAFACSCITCFRVVLRMLSMSWQLAPSHFFISCRSFWSPIHSKTWTDCFAFSEKTVDQPLFHTFKLEIWVTQFIKPG